MGAQLKFANKAEIPFQQLSIEQLRSLGALYDDAGPAMQSKAAQIATLERALSDKSITFAERELEKMVPAIVEYLLRDVFRGWLFRTNSSGKPIAYLVYRIDFTPPGDEETGRILIELKANAMAKIVSQTTTIYERDIVGNSIAEILATKGYFKESQALIKNYDRSAERYFDWRADYGRQFSGRGTGMLGADTTASHRTTD